MNTTRFSLYAKQVFVNALDETYDVLLLIANFTFDSVLNNFPLEVLSTHIWYRLFIYTSVNGAPNMYIDGSLFYST